MVIVTLTTDFGTLYPASMKGVILGIAEDLKIVDVTHSIPQADIRAGAFALLTVVDYFPVGTVHVAVVDPGVGTERKAIVIRAGGHYFVGPDNGLMVPAARKLGEMEIFEISVDDLPGSVSATFHGRDVFAKVGALLAKGVNVQELAHRTDDFVDISFPQAEIGDGRIVADVIYIDDFGNVITNVPAELMMEVSSFGDMLNMDGLEIPFLRTYAQNGVEKLLCLIGSHGYLEIAINQGNAAQMLGLQNGARVYSPLHDTSK